MNESLEEEGLIFTLPDGRKLGYLIIGTGKPVIYFHGHHSSRLDIQYLEEYAKSRNLRVIGVDRPGFGLSTYTPRLRLCDFVYDVNNLADYLEIDKFVLIGFSAGGPFVINYVALFPERISQAVVVSSPSLPLNVDEVFSGLEKIIVKLASKFRSLGLWYLKQEREGWLRFAMDPDAFLLSKEGRNLLRNMPEDDAKLLMDQRSGVGLDSIREFYCQGDDSILSLYEERLLLMQEWDVNFSRIPSGLVFILHGEDDNRSPIGDAYKNAEVIPDAQLKIIQNKGHFFWFNNPDILDEILK